MGNPQQAEEPTMEEILASIRRIIADDEDSSEDSTPDAGDQPADVEQDQDAQMEAQSDAHANDDVEHDVENDVEPSEPEQPMVVDEVEAVASDAEEVVEAEDDVFELSEIVEEAEPEMAAEPLDDLAEDTTLEDDIAFDDPPEAVAEPLLEPEPEMPSQPDNEAGDTLLSNEAQSTASAAFGMLASSMLSHSGGARTLEGIVEDLLRPLLKAWLDENLPPMVEQIVREEIERVARRR